MPQIQTFKYYQFMVFRKIGIRFKSAFAVTPLLKITDERTLKIVRKLKVYDVALGRIKLKFP